jgi:uncharacterized protein YggE
MNNEFFTQPVQKTIVTLIHSFIGLLILGSIFLAIGSIATLKSLSHRDAPLDAIAKLSVTGKGETFAIPDTATFSFSVNGHAATVQDAQKQATDTMNKALAYLKTANIPEKDVKTTDYSINPHYEYVSSACVGGACTPGKQVINGYDVSQTVLVKVADPSQAGTVLGGIGNLGVTNVSGLSLTVDDSDALEQDARKMAIDDAKAKAEVLAKQLGVRLGKIVDFQESNGGYPMPVMYKALDSAAGNQSAAPSIPTGQNKITSNITVTFEIN